jgi:hypothetical protein
MAENLDKPQPAPFTERFTVERLVLMSGVVVFPVLAIALGICIAVPANALRQTRATPSATAPAASPRSPRCAAPRLDDVDLSQCRIAAHSCGVHL